MISHFLGIDIGSSYTKFVVIDDNLGIVHSNVIPTLSRHLENYEKAISAIRYEFNIKRTCSTGYGRKNAKSDLQKTELICAAAGVSVLHPINKSILDIGGEDIKIIESDAAGNVVNFHMNDKCSAGTGSFIAEIAETGGT